MCIHNEKSNTWIGWYGVHKCEKIFYHAAWRELGRFFDYNSSIHITNNSHIQYIHEVTKIKLAGPNITGCFIKHWKTRKVLETSFYFICWIWNGCTGLAPHFVFAPHFVWQFLHLKFIYLSAFHEALKAAFLSWFILCIIHKTLFQYFQHAS